MDTCPERFICAILREMQIVTGFHAIEELIRSGKGKNVSLRLYYGKAGPRVKRIIGEAERFSVPVEETDSAGLDALSGGEEHRGVVLVIEGCVPDRSAVPDTEACDFDAFIGKYRDGGGTEDNVLVVILDSITDPHNVGAIIRSCDQFGVRL
ncbi:MAG: hypothetical protein LBR47_07505, partial [Spirochaetaceae bacterium]|nr:hypothetical protein [Spirochaetaceae bacterium]